MRILFIIIIMMLISGCIKNEDRGGVMGNVINLPEPLKKGNMSLEEAIAKRRSIRDYTTQPITLKELAQILWAAQGITSSDGKRAAPSAGALYPMDIYVVAGNVDGLEQGVYLYLPDKHALQLKIKGDERDKLCYAALSQAWVKEAPASIVIVANYEKLTWKYGKRGIRYAHIEAGHISQNIYLQVTSLGLGTVNVGAFDDTTVKEILKATGTPLVIMPVGHRS
ncbi:MAG TPA: SagB/ThcOx family dehydrogenase [Candidatus Aenigmarchaeota archaeon]|nr:SagB/ThcOx family dehydrogenase [Candidatus Aenigmarchaeota archaeon]